MMPNFWKPEKRTEIGRYLIILMVLCLADWGCRSNHSADDLFWRNYTTTLEDLDVSTVPYLETKGGGLQVIKSLFGRETVDDAEMREKGYVQIGYSSFTSLPHYESGAILLAKKLHASVIIVYQGISHTKSGTRLVPYQEFKRNRSGDIIGGRTSYRSESYRDDYYEHRVSYWVKGKDSVVRLGALASDLSTDNAKTSGITKGVRIVAVTQDSPAFKGGLVKEDIVTQIGDFKINRLDDYLEVLDLYTGREMPMVIWRNGKEITLTLKGAKQ